MKKMKKMKITFLYDNKGYFTELMRVENFSSNKKFRALFNRKCAEAGYSYDPSGNNLLDEPEYTLKRHNIKYVQESGDGQLYPVESLDEFKDEYMTEKGWGVRYETDFYEERLKPEQVMEIYKNLI